MKTNIMMCKVLSLMIGSLALPAWAAVTADQAARLGADLTPVGAQKAGNAAGTIPEWNGGMGPTEAPADAQGFRINPFKGDAPLFTITAANAQQYQEQLSEGQLAVLKRYPETFKMPVYPTRRTAAYPAFWYESTRENATHAVLSDGGNKIENYTRGTPFPITQSGNEAIWNHITRYTGSGMKRSMAVIVPQASGRFTPTVVEQEYVPAWNVKDYDPAKGANLLFYYKWRTLSPARLAGDVVMIHETMDQVSQPRLAWQYNAGQRRVRRAPQISYDGPSTGSDGQHTVDSAYLFSGATDRYDWKLVGKKEMYIPYNAYELDDPSRKYADYIRPGHLNPEHLRYELHRVWEVEATLKEGKRHIFPKRKLYIDEDTWQVALADLYDSRGVIWRVGESHQVQYAKEQIPVMFVENYYDLQSGRFYMQGLRNELPGTESFDVQFVTDEFSPGSLRRTGVR